MPAHMSWHSIPIYASSYVTWQLTKATGREQNIMKTQAHDERHEVVLDKTAFSVVSSFDEADEDDRQYWWTQSAEARLRYLEQLRHLNYGHHATARLQRVLEIVQRP